MTEWDLWWTAYVGALAGGQDNHAAYYMADQAVVHGLKKKEEMAHGNS
jgi:hypothetical protein